MTTTYRWPKPNPRRAAVDQQVAIQVCAHRGHIAVVTGYKAGSSKPYVVYCECRKPLQVAPSEIE